MFSQQFHESRDAASLAGSTCDRLPAEQAHQGNRGADEIGGCDPGSGLSRAARAAARRKELDPKKRRHRLLAITVESRVRPIASNVGEKSGGLPFGGMTVRSRSRHA